MIEKLTKEILKAERQSFEKVIRMMSHEINNSVGAVSSIIESTMNYMNNPDLSNNDEYVKVLNVAKDRIINLNHFTKRFSDIVKIPKPKLSQCEIKEIVNHILIYFKSELEDKNINVVTRFDTENMEILFDYQQLELVLINVIKNAIQAIEVKGKITIIYQNNPQILVIENNGIPISGKIEKNLFKPFFTTKKTGQGIGLTLIREILTNHSCDFSLRTRNDSITEFRIIFNHSFHS